MPHDGLYEALDRLRNVLRDVLLRMAQQDDRIADLERRVAALEAERVTSQG
jgi:polyhydroxyalkanoate synthesis regulator phasin